MAIIAFTGLPNTHKAIQKKSIDYYMSDITTTPNATTYNATTPIVYTRNLCKELYNDYIKNVPYYAQSVHNNFPDECKKMINDDYNNMPSGFSENKLVLLYAFNGLILVIGFISSLFFFFGRKNLKNPNDVFYQLIAPIIAQIIFTGVCFGIYNKYKKYDDFSKDLITFEPTTYGTSLIALCSVNTIVLTVYIIMIIILYLKKN